MTPRNTQGSGGWSVLRLLDDPELLRQEGLRWPSLFAQECSKRESIISEDELAYYELRGWPAPLMRVPRATEWFRLTGNGQRDEVEIPQGDEPGASLEVRYGRYGTASKVLPKFRDDKGRSGRLY